MRRAFEELRRPRAAAEGALGGRPVAVQRLSTARVVTGSMHKPLLALGGVDAQITYDRGVFASRMCPLRRDFVSQIFWHCCFFDGQLFGVKTCDATRPSPAAPCRL